MRSKKEKTPANGKPGPDKSAKLQNGSTDQFSEHQLFLQAFEKPTQIYRYLRMKHMDLPLFLQRSLTYMPKSNTLGISSREKRDNFRVDSMLKLQAQKRVCVLRSLKLKITGIEDRTRITDDVEIKMAVVRQNSAGPISKVFTHSCVASRNQCSGPSEVSIPEEAFYALQNNTKPIVFTLLLVVSLREPKTCKLSGKNSVDSDDQSDSDATDTESSLESSPKRPCIVTSYAGELVIYDDNSQCQLSEGEYKIVLRPELPHDCLTSRWITMTEKKANDTIPEDLPTMNLQLVWGSEYVKKSTATATTTTSTANQNNNDSTAIKRECSDALTSVQERRQTRVYYQFIFHNNSRQITEARGDLRCPWCFVDCRRLYSLLKHLKLCHSRFNFNYTPHRGGARIDVTVNDAYDGSYMGNPQRLVRRDADKYRYPLRRTPITYFMVCRPQRPLPTLSEFLQDYQEELGLGLNGGLKMGATVGHNRVYFHSHTCMPVKPEEFDYDSERESDPPWLREKTQRMLDDFTDVNDGEKFLMKLWNLHIMRMGIVADCHIPHAVTTFVEKHGSTILQQNLYRNFLLHLANLLEYGLISSSECYTSSRRLQLFAPKHYFLKQAQSGN